jgi:predicted ATPase
MAIKRFSFIDKFHCWTLEEMSFSPLNLLVGKSGVGKTNILKVLKSIQRAGIAGADRANGCEWMIEIESTDMKLLWEAKVSLVAETSIAQFMNGNEDEDEHENEKQSIEKSYFLKERIIRDEETEIVDRTEDNFVFKGKQLPKLKNTESAISLLMEEEDIAPLNKALRRMIFSPNRFEIYPFSESSLEKTRQKYPNLDALREARNIPSLIKAYILQEDYPEEFGYIKADYLDIFDTVKDIKLGRLSELDPCTSQEFNSTGIEDLLVFGLEEEGVKGWITSPRISSGMNRTFSYLIDLALAPPGTVIIIDEVENSLGVNCLPEIIERFLRRPRKLQFILTSHHPYIIQNIPSDQWQIVTRKGSTVRVVKAKTIPALKTNSAHDKFIQLINLKEFEEGIQ